MKNNTKIMFVVLATIIIVVILLLAGVIKFKKVPDSSDDNATNAVASTTEKNVGGLTFTGDGDLIVEQVPIKGSPSGVSRTPLGEPPSLDRPVIFPKNYSLEATNIMGKNIGKVVNQLKKTPSDFDSWMVLGIYREDFADYEGAKEAWNYASILYPNNPIPYANLADLYGYYLKDIVLAEANYLKAIEKEPNKANWYVRAADFYREVENNLFKARAILEKGLKVMPNDSSLLQALNAINNIGN